MHEIIASRKVRRLAIDPHQRTQELSTMKTTTLAAYAIAAFVATTATATAAANPPGPSGPSSPPEVQGVRGNADGPDTAYFAMARKTMNPGFCTRNGGDYYVKAGLTKCADY